MGPIQNHQIFPHNLDPLPTFAPLYDPLVIHDFNAPVSPELTTPILNISHPLYIPVPPPPVPPVLSPAAPTREEAAEQDDAFVGAPPVAPAPQHSKFADEFSSPGEEKQRELLDRCLSSDWLQRNERETTLRKQSILLGFLSRLEAPRGEALKYECLFKNCHKSFDRRDRALGHIRAHLSHRPFPCGEECGTVGWYAFYPRYTLDNSKF